MPTTTPLTSYSQLQVQREKDDTLQSLAASRTSNAIYIAVRKVKDASSFSSPAISSVDRQVPNPKAEGGCRV
jgi:precorrin-4 methylase